MDISILAAIGSFAVSERFLKPKATVFVILGCVLAYDLTTKTRDPSSLRVYRGPALFAFTLMMCALSLRKWRRNGVACDELLFLPGTVHAQKTAAIVPPSSSTGSLCNSSIDVENQNQKINNAHTHQLKLKQQLPTSKSISNISTSGGEIVMTRSSSTASSTKNSPAMTSLATPTVTPVSLAIPCSASSSSSSRRGRKNNGKVGKQQMPMSPMQGLNDDDVCDNDNSDHHCDDSSVSSIQEFVDSWDDDYYDDDENDSSGHDSVGVGDTYGTTTRGGLTTTATPPLSSSSTSNNVNIVPLEGYSSSRRDRVKQQQQQQQKLVPSTTPSTSSRIVAVSSSSSSASSNNSNIRSFRSADFLRRAFAAGQDEEEEAANTAFRDAHPQITRIGSFFFFRASQSSTQNATYAPSGPAVFGAALDLSMPILFNFHLFIEAFNRLGSDSIGCKTLPMIFLTVLMVRTCFPPQRRMRFWNTVSFIFLAPFQQSRFRDVYLGDVLTSLVRPCQDVLFALSYYVTVVWGTASGHYGLHRSGEMLQQSWVLMNVILPSCALLPLWFKFLQTLRECYDSGKRWPHLGNAFKYLSASLVILYGMTHPEDRRSPLWLISFGLALLYQIFWDTVMDWELFVIAPPRPDEQPSVLLLDLEGSSCGCLCVGGISSVRPTSRTMLAMQRQVFQPIRDFCALVLAIFPRPSRVIPSWRQIQLRPRRLYKSQSFYWRIFFLNAVMRFTWMLCFIPHYRLSSRDNRHVVTTFSSDTITYVGVLLPAAEIVRRTLWGFLYLEMKTIKMMDGGGTIGGGGEDKNNNNPLTYSKLDMNNMDDEYLRDVTEVSADSEDSSKQPVQRPLSSSTYLPLGLRNQQQQDLAATSSSQSSRWARCIQWRDEIRHKLFIAELSMWAVVFVGLGLWATN